MPFTNLCKFRVLTLSNKLLLNEIFAQSLGGDKKKISFNNNLLLKVNTLNLHKLVKGILVHNGYFFVKDVMKHFQII
jgi:hypothetical protein